MKNNNGLVFVCFVMLFIFFTDGLKSAEIIKKVKFSSELIKQLDQIIENEMVKSNLPGVVVGIWIPGKGDYLKAFGKADIEKKKKRLFDDVFRIASITKTFTATVILSLVDDGLLKTSDPLSKFLPDFPNGEKITIRNLLRMRSGIVDFADKAILKEWYSKPHKNYPLDTLIDIMKSRGKNFLEAGKQTVYCNGNYTILAKVAEIVSKKSFASLVKEKVIKPLNLTSTLYAEADNFYLGGSNRGYSWEQIKKQFIDKTEINTSCTNAAGAIISNMTDLRKYAEALYKGTLLSKETQKHRLETETFKGASSVVQYGEGILKEGGFYGHNGTIFGFSTEMFYLPAEDAVIVINVNRLDLDDKSRSGKVFVLISKLIFPEHVSW